MQEFMMTTLSISELRSIIREELLVLIEKMPKDNTPPSEEKMSIKQLMEYLSCSKQTIMNYKKRRVIPYYQTGRKIYFKKSEVDTALASKMSKR